MTITHTPEGENSMATNMTAGPTDERITAIWNFSCGGSFVPDDTKAFARAVWDAAAEEQAHLLATGAERESELAAMIGAISDVLGLTEAEQFEANGADKILARIAALLVAHAPRVVAPTRQRAPAPAANFGVDGPHDGTDHHQIWKRGGLAAAPRAAGIVQASQVDKSAALHGGAVDEIANLQGRVVDAEFPGTQTAARFTRLHDLQTWLICREIGNAAQPALSTVQGWVVALSAITGIPAPGFLMHARGAEEILPDVAFCIAQLDVWNGRLESAIDRSAHAQLGQHPNDDQFAGGHAVSATGNAQ